MSEDREYVLTARTPFTIEMDHPSSWDPKSCAEQVFNAGDRENTNALEHMILEYRKSGGSNIRILSHNTAVVVYKRKA